MIVDRTDIERLILGSTFYGTGGGGSPKEAQVIFDLAFGLKEKIELCQVADLADDGVIVSTFGVGSVGSLGDPSRPLRESVRYLTQYLGEPIAAVVPVEIGPKSLAMAFYLAALMDCPVVDADIVGGRSTPEVFLETITLFEIPRTPAVLSNNAGDIVVLARSSSAEQEEALMRDFAVRSNGQAYVTGYRLTKSDALRALELETVSRTCTAGDFLVEKKASSLINSVRGRVWFEGVIDRIEDVADGGFMIRNVYLSNSESSARLYVKNENLIFWIGSEAVSTCPDLIVLIDKETSLPLYNLEMSAGQAVQVCTLPTLPLWRSEQGKKLFSPRLFGFDIEVRLLEVSE